MEIKAQKASFFLSYSKGKPIPKKLRLNLKISEVINVAKELFSLPEQGNFGLKLNGQLVKEEDMMLETLPLNEGHNLEIVEMDSLSTNAFIISIILEEKNPPRYEIEACPSKTIYEVLLSFCKSQSIELDDYLVFISDALINQEIKCCDLEGGEKIVLNLVKNKSLINDDARPKDDSEETKIFKITISGDDTYEMPIKWLLDLNHLKDSLANDRGFPPLMIQKWNAGGKELSDLSSLKSQIEPNCCTIDIYKLHPFPFKIGMENEAEDKIINLDINRQIQFLKGDIETLIKIESNHQAWFLNEGKDALKDEDRLADYLNDCGAPTIFIQDISMFFSQNTMNHLMGRQQPGIVEKPEISEIPEIPEIVEVPVVSVPETSTTAKKRVIVSIKETVKEFVCEGALLTVGDLQKDLEESEDIEISKQVLILLKQDKWERKLTDPDEKLTDLIADDEEFASILLMKTKKFTFIQGLENETKIFEGLTGAQIQDQKQFFEMAYRIPATNQIWALGSVRSPQILNDNATLESYDIQASDDSNPIRIFRKITITVCLNEKTDTLQDCASSQTIKAIKRLLYKPRQRPWDVSPQDQLWIYQDKELGDNQTLEEIFEPDLDEDPFSPSFNCYAVDLVVLTSLEYFGFTEKVEININLFYNFSTESDELLQEIVENLSFSPKESLPFRNKLLGILFGTLKKHSLWENLIRKIKQIAFEKKFVRLWESNDRNVVKNPTFNTQFLLYYFLNCGTPELNVEILKIMKMHFPIPLAINSWTHRFYTEGLKIIKDVYWVLQKSFVIASFGLGGAEQQVCGKSELLNTLLFSNFVKAGDRDPICQGCPEILFDIYKNNNFPVNIVDIPAGVDEEIVNKIISNSNMLIVHSFVNDTRTLDLLSKLPSKVPMIIFLRDINNAFDGTENFDKQLSSSLSDALANHIFKIKLPNLDDRYSSVQVKEISTKVHEFILKTFKKTNDNDLWNFSKFFEGCDQQIHVNLLNKITKNSTNLIQAIPVFEEFKQLERDQEIVYEEKQEKSKKLKEDFGKKLLAPEVKELLELLVTHEISSRQGYSERSQLFLEKLQEYLRIMRTQQTKDFYELYKFKADLSSPSKCDSCDSCDACDVNQSFSDYWKSIKEQNNLFKKKTLNRKGDRQNKLEFAESCIEMFEEKYLPNIFSIELFWRELIYFNYLVESHEIEINSSTLNKRKEDGSMYLSEFLTKFKKKDIMRGVPFEIIDGDLLYLPKKIFKQIFTGNRDRVFVISILGPQSSGKSTLLNFLFGCNFVTSSGRCTKGVYGTYFKLSNPNSYDGILILDTEGLFGLLNKREMRKREKFDLKLALFCLAMSDLVLINFKGDIDQTLTDILTVCQDSLIKLQQGNVEAPDMFLILNQNTQTDINNHLQEINNISNLGFSQANTEVLPLAFDIYTEKNPAGNEKLMESIEKRKPKTEFIDACNRVVKKIFDIMSSDWQTKNQMTLKNVMDRMAHIWELFDKFPDLLQRTTLRDQQREEEIKQWIHTEVDQRFKAEQLSAFTDIVNKTSDIETDLEHNFQSLFADGKSQIIQRFKERFNENTSYDLYHEMEKLLFSHMGRVWNEIRTELNTLIYQIKIKIYDKQGVGIIRDAAHAVNSRGNLTEEEKNQAFEEAWANFISKLDKTYDRGIEAENLLQIVRENYQAKLITLTGGLPTTSFPKDTELSFDDYRTKLFALIDRNYTIDKAFEFTKQAPALILKGGKTNVTFEYLDLRRYIEEILVEEFIGFPKAKTTKLLNIPEIRTKLLRSTEQGEDGLEQQPDVVKESLNDVQKQLKGYGLKVDIEFLDKVLRYKKKNFGNVILRNPVKSEELNRTTCQIFRLKERKYHDSSMTISHIIETKIQEYFKKKATFRSLFECTLSFGIIWSRLGNLFDYKLREITNMKKGEDVIKKLERDLQKINLKFDNIQETLISLVFKRLRTSKHDMKSLISTVSDDPLRFSQFKDVVAQDFTFIKPKVLEENIKSLPDKNCPQHLILGKWRGKKLVVKKEYSHVTWLDTYAKGKLKEIFQNTIQNKALLKLVFQDFALKRLLERIYDACLKNLKKFDNWNLGQLYQSIVRETNDFISAANNDLQQVSYRLDFELVGYIHLSLVYMIWKYFEEKHWAKITEPLTQLKAKKEQQRSHFWAMVSLDHPQLNEAEAEKAKQYLQAYLMTEIISKAKKEIIETTAARLRTEKNRREVQEEVDSEYFSPNAVVNNDALYSYILNPHKTLVDTYDRISENYLGFIRTELDQRKIEIYNLLQDLQQRLGAIESTLVEFGEDFWAFDKIFVLQRYEDELGACYYNILLEFLKGNGQALCAENDVNTNTQVAERNKISIPIPSLASHDLDKIFEVLGQPSIRVTNILLFLRSFNEKLRQLSIEISESFNMNEDNIREFKSRVNIFICNHKCPCCERICSVEDPSHQYHQCLYGHQIRAIGGVMLGNKDASVSRCEDISDLSLLQFNGQEMNWYEFKHLMKNLPNNPWIFDDVASTRKDDSITERFKLAWTLIGQRICEERYKNIGMKYVPFNQKIEKAVVQPSPKTFIYMIDSSGSMSGDKWASLKKSLRDILWDVSNRHMNNKVVILNFSSHVLTEYLNDNPKSVIIENLAFQGCGTDFEKVFECGYDHIRKVKKMDIVLTFMTDGQDQHPKNALEKIKEYLGSVTFKELNIKFSFSSLGFQCHSDILNDIAQELGGDTYYAEDEEQLNDAFLEILNKNIE